MDKTVIKVTKLFYYPIKSAHEYQKDEIKIERKGAINDRVFLIVKKKDLTPISFKNYPQIYYIETKYEDNKVHITIPFEKSPKTFTLEINPKAEYPKENIYKTVTSGCSCDGVSLDNNLNNALSEYFGEECLILYCIGERFLKDYHKPKMMHDLKENDSMTYNFTAPFLIITEESLNYLNELLAKRNEKKVEAMHFRPNIVVQGGSKEFWEKSPSKFKVNNMVFRNIKPCTRCMVNII